MDAPLISIITPSYNQSEYIEDLLNSIIEQDCQNIEHIIVDGGSTDDTVEILKEYEERYNLRWISEPDDSIPNALNKGIKMANGEWVGFQSADDYYLPGAFSAYEQIMRSTSANVIYGDQLFIDAENNIIGLRVHTRPSKFIQKHWHHFASYHTIMIKRELLTSIGMFDERYKYIHDGDLFWRLLTTDEVTTFVHKQQFLAARRKHNKNLSTTHGDPEQYKWEQEHLYDYSAVEDKLPDKPLFILSIVIKTLHLIDEGKYRSVYNMYLDLINKTFHEYGYEGKISFSKEQNIQRSTLNYEW